MINWVKIGQKWDKDEHERDKKWLKT